MGIVNVVFQLVKGGKRGVALVGLIAVYVLNRYFGIVVAEQDVVELILNILGAVGVVHGAWKSETMQKIVTGIKAKSEADKTASTEQKK